MKSVLAGIIGSALGAVPSNIRVDNPSQNEKIIYVAYGTPNANQFEIGLVFQRGVLRPVDSAFIHRLGELPEFKSDYISAASLSGATSSPVIGSAGYSHGQLACHYRDHGLFGVIDTRDLGHNNVIKDYAALLPEARKLCTLIHNVRKAALQTSIDEYSDSFLRYNIGNVEWCDFSSDSIQGSVGRDGSAFDANKQLIVNFQNGVGEYARSVSIPVRDNSPAVRCAVARGLTTLTQAEVNSASELQAKVNEIAHKKGGSA